MALTGNSSYIGGYDGSNYAYTAYAIELSMQRDFIDAFFDDEPLLRLIRDGGANFNKGVTVEGTSVIAPILGADTVTNVANGVLDADELTQPTAEIIRGFTQCSYAIAHYRKPTWIRSSERKLAMGPATAKRGDLLQGVTLQIMKSFTNAVNGDLMSANAGARDAVQGVRHVLSESNTVGGIAQSTDTFWQAKVTTAIGTFSLDAVNDLYDEASRGKERPNLLLAAYAASNNIFGKIRSAIQPAQQLMTSDAKAKYGFTDLVYLDMPVVKDDAGTAGEVLGLNTNSWFYYGDTRPYLAKQSPWPGTDADVLVHSMYCSVGCTNPRLNFRGTGLT